MRVHTVRACLLKNMSPRQVFSAKTRTLDPTQHQNLWRTCVASARRCCADASSAAVFANSAAVALACENRGAGKGAIEREGRCEIGHNNASQSAAVTSGANQRVSKRAAACN